MSNVTNKLSNVQTFLDFRVDFWVGHWVGFYTWTTTQTTIFPITSIARLFSLAIPLAPFATSSQTTLTNAKRIQKQPWPSAKSATKKSSPLRPSSPRFSEPWRSDQAKGAERPTLRGVGFLLHQVLTLDLTLDLTLGWACLHSFLTWHAHSSNVRDILRLNMRSNVSPHYFMSSNVSI